MSKHIPDHAASVAVAVAGTDMSGAVAKVMAARYKAQRDDLRAALEWMLRAEALSKRLITASRLTKALTERDELLAALKAYVDASPANRRSQSLADAARAAIAKVRS